MSRRVGADPPLVAVTMKRVGGERADCGRRLRSEGGVEVADPRIVLVDAKGDAGGNRLEQREREEVLRLRAANVPAVELGGYDHPAELAELPRKCRPQVRLLAIARANGRQVCIVSHHVKLKIRSAIFLPKDA